MYTDLARRLSCSDWGHESREPGARSTDTQRRLNQLKHELHGSKLEHDTAATVVEKESAPAV